MINALSSRIGESEIWKLLLARGWTEEKLKRDMKKKSLFLLGKAEYFNLDSSNAIVHLQEALDVLNSYGSNGANPGSIPGSNGSNSPTAPGLATKEVDEIKDLLSKAKARQANESKKEKSMWSKAFKDNNTAPDDDGNPITNDTDTTGSNNKGGGVPKDLDIKLDMNKLIAEAPTSSASTSTTNTNTSASDNNNSNNNALMTTDSYMPLIIMCVSSIVGVLGVGWRFGWFKRLFK